jgi:hypothetical protein
VVGNPTDLRKLLWCPCRVAYRDKGSDLLPLSSTGFSILFRTVRSTFQTLVLKPRIYCATSTKRQADQWLNAFTQQNFPRSNTIPTSRFHYPQRRQNFLGASLPGFKYLATNSNSNLPYVIACVYDYWLRQAEVGLQ